MKYRLFATILLAAPITAFPFANPGHMAVAGLAYDELSTAERSKLITIMKQHPDLQPVLDGFPKGNPSDRDFFMAAATWPDRIKSDKAYQSNGYEENDPAPANIKFDHKMHKGYHFIDMPLWLGDGPAPQLPATPKVNAVAVINVLVGQLKSGETDSAKAYDLFWLLHLCGDIHQPLHAVSGVTATYPNGDVGGNLVKVTGVPGESELHAFWDDIPGRTAKSDRKTHKPRLDKDVKTANAFIVRVKNLPLDPVAATNLDPAIWANESFQVAKDDGYDLDLEVIPSGHDDGLKAQLDSDYVQTAADDTERRVRLAGHRLALVLRQILP